MKTETLKTAIELAKLLECDGVQSGEDQMWELGKNYLIRTVTMIQIGKLHSITDKELKLQNACWVADTGRFSEALKTGKLNEVEMFINPVIVNRSAIIDATEWTHALPNQTL